MNSSSSAGFDIGGNKFPKISQDHAIWIGYFVAEELVLEQREHRYDFLAQNLVQH